MRDRYIFWLITEWIGYSVILLINFLLQKIDSVIRLFILSVIIIFHCFFSVLSVIRLYLLKHKKITFSYSVITKKNRFFLKKFLHFIGYIWQKFFFEAINDNRVYSKTITERWLFFPGALKVVPFEISKNAKNIRNFLFFYCFFYKNRISEVVP